MSDEQVFWVKITNTKKYHVFKQVHTAEPYVWNPSRSLCNSYWLEGKLTISASPGDRNKCKQCQKRLEKIFKLLLSKKDSKK